MAQKKYAFVVFMCFYMYKPVFIHDVLLCNTITKKKAYTTSTANAWVLNDKIC